jgi:hypothetical protein
MVSPAAVGTRLKRLVMIRHRAKGQVGRILWIVAIDYLMKERHARPIGSGNKIRIAQCHASYDYDKQRDYDT